VQRIAGRGFGDHHWAFEARLQVIQNAVDSVRVRRRQLVDGGDVVDLDDDVLLGLQAGPDLVVDGGERLLDVLAAAIAFNQGDGGIPLGADILAASGRSAGARAVNCKRVRREKVAGT